MTPAADRPRVCIVGAGSSGIAAAQVLDARGIDFDCFEMGSDIGGNWRYGNDNGVSSAYRSLHINTSRQAMEYATYPMPAIAARTTRATGRSRSTSTTTSTTSGCATRSRFRYRGGEGRARRRRRVRRDRPPVRTHRRHPRGRDAAATTTCSWPTATTGTRAGPSRASPAATPSPGSRSTPTTTASPTSSPASGWWCSGSATPPPTSRWSRRRSPPRPISRCAAERTSCRSSCSARPPTS